MGVQDVSHVRGYSPGEWGVQDVSGVRVSPGSGNTRCQC